MFLSLLLFLCPFEASQFLSTAVRCFMFTFCCRFHAESFWLLFLLVPVFFFLSTCRPLVLLLWLVFNTQHVSEEHICVCMAACICVSFSPSFSPPPCRRNTPYFASLLHSCCKELLHSLFFLFFFRRVCECKVSKSTTGHSSCTDYSCVLAKGCLRMHVLKLLAGWEVSSASVRQ